MVTIAKPARCGFRCLDAVVALDFQPSAHDDCSVERLAAAAGSQIKIWAVESGAKTLCVAVLDDHAPAYVVALRWSPSGEFLASCDARSIALFAFQRFTLEPDGENHDENAASATAADCGGPSLESWKLTLKMTSSEVEFLDMAWVGCEQLLMGTSDGLRLWDVKEQRAIYAFEGPRGPVKGVCAHGLQYIAAQGEDKVLHIWEAVTVAAPAVLTADGAATAAASNAKTYRLLLTDSESFANAPAETPYYRRGSFEAGGGFFAAFPGGSRGAQSFGVMHSLPVSAKETAPWRFRGHVSRVCAVSFSRAVFAAVTDSDSATNSATGFFTLYAQASSDGALSIWRVSYGPAGAAVKGEMLLLLKPRFVDEEASVVDMSWTCNGRTLAVGADDGSITLVTISEADVPGRRVSSTLPPVSANAAPAPRSPSVTYKAKSAAADEEEKPPANAGDATPGGAVVILEPKKKKKVAEDEAQKL